jgi:hypothetical protein
MMHSPLWTRHLLEEHERMLRELAARPRLDRPDRTRRTWIRDHISWLGPKPATLRSQRKDVTIRRASTRDAAQLAELAAMSERRVPTGAILVAEVEHALVAAVPLDGGPALSDISRPTADVIQLLELRSNQLRRAARAA